MTTLLHSTIGGEVIQTGPKRLEFSYKPGFVTIILVVFSIIAFLMGTIFGILSLTGNLPKPPPPFPICIFFFAVGLGLVWKIRFRKKSMGNFVVDGDKKKLVYKISETKTKEWNLGDIKFDLKWDPFYRSFQFQYWLVAKTKEKETLRLAKGPMEDMKKIRAMIFQLLIS